MFAVSIIAIFAIGPQTIPLSKQQGNELAKGQTVKNGEAIEKAAGQIGEGCLRQVKMVQQQVAQVRPKAVAPAVKAAPAPQLQADAVEDWNFAREVCHTCATAWFVLTSGINVILILTCLGLPKRCLLCCLACLSVLGGILAALGVAFDNRLFCVGLILIALAHAGCATLEVIRLVRAYARTKLIEAMRG